MANSNAYQMIAYQDLGSGIKKVTEVYNTPFNQTVGQTYSASLVSSCDDIPSGAGSDFGVNWTYNVSEAVFPPVEAEQNFGPSGNTVGIYLLGGPLNLFLNFNFTDGSTPECVWTKNGVVIPGETTDILTPIPVCSYADGGLYTCTATSSTYSELLDTNPFVQSWDVIIEAEPT